MIYLWLKLTHLLALIAWLGPATGAYWILLRLGKTLGTAESQHLERCYEEVLIAEHAAFTVLLASGWAMFQMSGGDLSAMPWLKNKLFFVAGIVAVEIVDIALSHFYFRALFRGGATPDAVRWNKFLRLRGLFYAASIPVLIILILATLAQAVMKL